MKQFSYYKSSIDIFDVCAIDKSRKLNKSIELLNKAYCWQDSDNGKKSGLITFARAISQMKNKYNEPRPFRKLYE
jgi:hypothetical protein